jgi:hypothetical protein
MAVAVEYYKFLKENLALHAEENDRRLELGLSVPGPEV